MKIKTLCLPLLLLLTLALHSCITEGSDAPREVIEHVKVDDPVPAFTVKYDGNTTFSSTSFIGKNSYLLFFDTGCGDCRREMPVLQEALNTLKSNPDFQFVAIARGQSKEEIDKYWQENNFTMPVYLDPDKSVYNLFANTTIPRLYLINKKGIVVWMGVERFRRTAQDFVDMVKELE